MKIQTTLEELGVDRLFVDEAHSYKNLFLYTKMQNVAGLSTSDAQKSSDMFAKCRYMDELTGSRGVIFATGTPVSNSMTELYTMQQHIINYAKTRDVYVAYRKAGYSKKFLSEHESEIILHKAAKQFFDEQNLKKLPTVKSLQAEYAQLLSENRYVGSYPVIGIRPIIDGRRGPMKLRESLESQVMAMAEAAKKLFENTLYYSNGDHVKVVIADSTIGRVPESAACAEKFRREGVSITLSVTPCWCYGSETMDMDPMTIKGVWGFNGTERPGAVYLASVLATHAQKGLPAFGIYGHEVQDADQVTEIPEDVKEKLLRFGRAAVAAATMHGKSYLQIGSMVSIPSTPSGGNVIFFILSFPP